MTIRKLALLLLALPAGAVSWVFMRWSVDPLRRAAFKYWWGFVDPAMERHWFRLFHPDQVADSGGFWDDLKNIGTEWCRLNAMRGYKVLALMGLVQGLVGLGLGFCLGRLL